MNIITAVLWIIATVLALIISAGWIFYYSDQQTSFYQKFLVTIALFLSVNNFVLVIFDLYFVS